MESRNLPVYCTTNVYSAQRAPLWTIMITFTLTALLYKALLVGGDLPARGSRSGGTHSPKQQFNLAYVFSRYEGDCSAILPDQRHELFLLSARANSSRILLEDPESTLQAPGDG